MIFFLLFILFNYISFLGVARAIFFSFYFQSNRAKKALTKEQGKDHTE